MKATDGRTLSDYSTRRSPHSTLCCASSRRRGRRLARGISQHRHCCDLSTESLSSPLPSHFLCHIGCHARLPPTPIVVVSSQFASVVSFHHCLHQTISLSPAPSSGFGGALGPFPAQPTPAMLAGGGAAPGGRSSCPTATRRRCKLMVDVIT